MSDLTPWQLRSQARALRGVLAMPDLSPDVRADLTERLDAVQAELRSRGDRPSDEGLSFEIRDSASDKWLRNYSLSWLRGQLSFDTSVRLQELLERRLTQDGTSRLDRELLLQVHEHLAHQDRYASWVMEQVREERADLLERIERLERERG